jgi:DHA2 family multidrug resistance protein
MLKLKYTRSKSNLNKMNNTNSQRPTSKNQNQTFSMPMVKNFVPRQLQPWMYVFFAVVFQLTGTIYLGSLGQIMGETSFMREDVMMVNMFNVVGVNMPFPLLFRMKFRFTNRQLLLNATIILIICNIAGIYIRFLPLLCLMSFIAGFFKLCGTFECMSNIQLWMTPKRDFRIFFPLLYIIVLGDMSLSSWISTRLTYLCGSWTAMNWFIVMLLLVVLLLVFAFTKPFRFMKPLPFISIDWLGCMLWSAVLLEVIFLFIYGEYYNWTDGAVWRNVLVGFIFTLIMCLGRMFNIRHPYIEPNAFSYKRLLPLIGMFFVAEIMSSTGNAIGNVFTGSVMKLDFLTLSNLKLWAWVGSFLGCTFTLLWFKGLKQKYTKLLTIGFALLLTYDLCMYFIVCPQLNYARLILPEIVRNMGYAIFFTSLTIYLEDLMPFEHFFMGLTMTGFARNGLGESVCTGIYSYGIRHHVTDNMTRWAWAQPFDNMQPLLVAIKQMFGYMCMAGCIFLLILMLWNIQPVRSTIQKMPYWNVLGKKMRKRLERKLSSVLIHTTT